MYYTCYSEAGGVGKTTLVANLAERHAEHGYDVLAIDLDTQDASLTYLLGVDAPRDDGTADNIVRHMVGNPAGEFADLVHDTDFGFDLVPSHNMLESLSDSLSEAQSRADDPDAYQPFDQLRRVLVEAGVPTDYDAIVIDPPASTGAALYAAVGATRSLVVPVEATGKGMQSIRGLEGVTVGLEDELDASIGVLAVVPVGVGRTTDQERYLDEITTLGYPAPVAIRERKSLMEGCWDAQCPAVPYIREHRRQQRDHEMETVEKLDQLARHIEEVTA